MLFGILTVSSPLKRRFEILLQALVAQLVEHSAFNRLVARSNRAERNLFFFSLDSYVYNSLEYLELLKSCPKSLSCTKSPIAFWSNGL